jgi:hypothetical protein
MLRPTSLLAPAQDGEQFLHEPLGLGPLGEGFGAAQQLATIERAAPVSPLCFSP